MLQKIVIIRVYKSKWLLKIDAGNVHTNNDLLYWQELPFILCIVLFMPYPTTE